MMLLQGGQRCLRDLYPCDIEAVDTRYTAQWKHTAALQKQRGFQVTVTLGGDILMLHILGVFPLFEEQMFTNSPP